MTDNALTTAYDPAAPAVRECIGCHEQKPLSEFYARERRTVRRCKECSKAKSKARHWEKRDEVLVGMRDRYQRNKSAASEYMHAYRQKNSEQLKAKKKAYAELTRAQQARRMADWKSVNRDLVDLHESFRRAAKHAATVAWADRTEIRRIYHTARAMRTSGARVHVDHIVPLKSPLLQSLSGNLMPRRMFVGPLLPVVQGFHTQQNLAVIGVAANIAKHNRQWPDMPDYQGL